MMRPTQSLSVTLPHEMVDMIKAKLAAGEYASESEVIRDGLRSLKARDAALTKWLQEDVAKVLMPIKPTPVSAFPHRDED